MNDTSAGGRNCCSRLKSRCRWKQEVVCQGLEEEEEEEEEEVDMADDVPPSLRLVNFVSEEQLDEAKKTRGERLEDGTAQRNRPLFEILKENKDKKDAEFNERFKHRPPKALDEDETEFLDRLAMSRREYERQMADEEAKQLRSFQAAIEAQSDIVDEVKETPPVPKVEEHKVAERKKAAARPLNMIIKVKPQAKKAKMDPASSEEPFETIVTPNLDKDKPSNVVRTPNDGSNESHDLTKTGLVSYSDESEDD